MSKQISYIIRYDNSKGDIIMFKKKFTANFIILLLPMLIVSTLIDIVYSNQVYGYIEINWLIVILLAIVLDAFITWMQTRKDKENKSE